MKSFPLTTSNGACLSLVLSFILIAATTVSAIDTSEREALITLYNSTKGDSWTDNGGWKEGEGFSAPGTECSWYGVDCYGGNHVYEINLPNNNLTVGIPAAICDLPHLQVLNLMNNSLSGTLPAELGSLSNLVRLRLHNNALNGSIPVELSELENLIELDLGDNDLGGTIPAELGDLSLLQILDLSLNDLEGAIPVELGNVSQLVYLALNGNILSGAIPPELGGLENLVTLALGWNARTSVPTSGLTGQIPLEICDLSNLEYLHLALNKLEGTIPPELGKLTQLRQIWLNDNRFTGDIPIDTAEPERGLDTLGSLEQLWLHNNTLEGGLPPELGSLNHLKDLRLGNNLFSGGIPDEWGDLAWLEQLELQGNQLTGNIPEELGELSMLTFLNLADNHLDGTLPVSMVNLAALQVLILKGNKLAGALPDLSVLTHLLDDQSDLRWNALSCDDADLSAFLDTKQGEGDWGGTQTLPPTNLGSASSTPGSITLSWDPMVYTSDSGGYEIAWGTLPETYPDAILLPGKTASFYSLSGLDAGRTYYLRMRSYTESHADNLNRVTSEYTDPLKTTTAGGTSLTVADIQVNEGDANALFTITANPPGAWDITVGYATSDGSALANVDYLATTGTANIAAGGTETTVTVPLVNDGLIEGVENFTLILSDALNAHIAKPTAQATIIDNDYPSLSVSDVSAAEDTGNVTFTISTSMPISADIMVDFTTQDLTATAGSDYTSTSGTATIPGGELEIGITVSIANDNLAEDSETFSLILDNAVNATIAVGSAEATIIDNDVASLTVAGLTVSEDAGNTLVTITSSNPCSRDITFEYTTQDGIAVADEDYRPVAGTAMLPAGETTTSLSVEIIDDTLSETDETLTVTISNAAHATIAQASATLTIFDNDEASLVIDDLSTGEDAGNALITITASNPSSQDITVEYTTEDGTAVANEDYRPVAGTAILPAGETTTSLMVEIIDDTVSEPDETLTVKLSNATQATIAQASATLTIIDDETVASAENILGAIGGDSSDGGLCFIDTASP